MLKAISFDYWNTIFINNKEVGRKQARIDFLCKKLEKYGDFTGQEVLDSYDSVTGEFLTFWRTEQKTFGARTCLQKMAGNLHFTFIEDDLKECSRYFQEILLDYPPDIVPGVIEIVPAFASRYSLGIISDTWLTSGRVLAELLKRHGLHGCFRSFVFSDQIGYAKPRPEPFIRSSENLGIPLTETCHIGDLEETDIEGAKNAGCYSGRFLPPGENSDGTKADFVFSDFFNLEKELLRLL